MPSHLEGPDGQQVLAETPNTPDVGIVFQKAVGPSMLLARKLGNLGNGSVFGSLASVLASAKAEELQGKRVGVFTRGGGTAVFFSLRIASNTAVINKRLDLEERLANIKVVPLRPPANTEVAQVSPCVHVDSVSNALICRYLKRYQSLFHRPLGFWLSPGNLLHLG